MVGRLAGLACMPAKYAFFGCGLLVAFSLACGTAVAGEEAEDSAGEPVKPLWEVGVGAFAGWLPDYPASGENTARALAVPYLVYRGDFWRVGGEENRGAVSGRFLNTDKFEFDVTLSAAFPVDSSDNDARENMPDLDFLFGIGPQLIVKLINTPGRERLNLNLQARIVYSSDFSSISHQGYVFNPKLSYTRQNVSDLNLKLFGSVGPVLATEELMDYFYEVAPEFATPTRPAYDADAGYLGSNITLGVSKRFNRKFRAVLGTRLGVYYGASNDDSPLFEDKVTLSGFLAFAWSFAQSAQPAR
jgi:outer membrane scaffolding protein for murein synthesis (MipA/OmpV family)